nr:unnamed protein product [Callosobruchus analis]
MEDPTSSETSTSQQPMEGAVLLWKELHEEVFSPPLDEDKLGLGTVPGHCTIELSPDAKPVVQETKIIVPKELRPKMLSLVHEPHFGITKTKLCVRQLFYWPYLAKDVENLIANCKTCQFNQKSNSKETLISHPVPWQYVFCDIFEFSKNDFLLLVDSYSNWAEVAQITSKTAENVISFCKKKFAQFGVPDIMYADNNPFSSHKFKNFAQEWNFLLKFSSPYHHQSNGLAERFVGIVKEMLHKEESSKDLHSLLMENRNTSLPNVNYSPAQLLLNKVIKTKIPVSLNTLQPNIPRYDEVQMKLNQKQGAQKQYYDRHAKDLPKLQVGENILFQRGQLWETARVKDIVNDRSYIITDSCGRDYHRNRIFLRKTNIPYVP